MGATDIWDLKYRMAYVFVGVVPPKTGASSSAHQKPFCNERMGKSLQEQVSVTQIFRLNAKTGHFVQEILTKQSPKPHFKKHPETKRFSYPGENLETPPKRRKSGLFLKFKYDEKKHTETNLKIQQKIT